jgi:hypothetical protein
MPRRTNNKPMPVAKVPPPAAQPKAPPPAAPPKAPLQSQQAPSVTDSIKQGFSFGIGSAIAHNMVNRVFSKPEAPQPITKPAPITSEKMYELYNQCMEKNDKNVNCSDILKTDILN